MDSFRYTRSASIRPALRRDLRVRARASPGTIYRCAVGSPRRKGDHCEDAPVVVGRLGQAQFVEDASDVALDGLLAQEQPLRDGTVGPALGDVLEDVAFAGGQVGE